MPDSRLCTLTPKGPTCRHLRHRDTHLDQDKYSPRLYSILHNYIAISVVWTRPLSVIPVYKLSLLIGRHYTTLEVVQRTLHCGDDLPPRFSDSSIRESENQFFLFLRIHPLTKLRGVRGACFLLNCPFSYCILHFILPLPAFPRRFSLGSAFSTFPNFWSHPRVGFEIGVPIC